MPILTIDGLSGTGKTCIASQIAADLGWQVLYSDCYYRFLAYCYLNMRFGIDQDYTISAAVRADLFQLSCRVNQFGDVVILLGNQDLSQDLSSEEVAVEAVRIAMKKCVRTQLITMQRCVVRLPGLVAEGHDMGRVVFPQADLRVYLTASDAVRVQRRFNQLNRGGNTAKIHEIAELQAERDAKDKDEYTYQLLSKQNAVFIIDTSTMSISAVKEAIYRELLNQQVKINL